MYLKIKILGLTAIGITIFFLGWLYLWPATNIWATQSYGNPVNCSSLVAGDNVKANRTNMPAIWNVGDDNKLRPFLDGADFKTWHSDDGYEGHYKLVTPDCISSFQVATTMPLYINSRPGSVLIKQKGKDQLYVILPNNTKAPITKSTASLLYGTNYEIRTLDTGAFFNYHNNAPQINDVDPQPHAGMLIMKGQVIYYVTKCSQLREVSSNAFIENGFKNKYVQLSTEQQTKSLAVVNKIETKYYSLTHYTQKQVTDACGNPTFNPANPLSCPINMQDCNGVCKNLETDINNCGACGKNCGSNQACINSQCINNNSNSTITCNPQETACNNQCVETQVDISNCGVCNNSCATGQSCVSGSCTNTPTNCQPGQTKCSNQCINTQTNFDNCGACGQVCNSNQTCTSGQCITKNTNTVTCTSPETTCNNQCVKTQTDINNCGVCNNSCATGQSCVSGTCTANQTIKTGTLSVMETNLLQANSFVLTGSLTNIFDFTVDANNEDIDLQSIKFKLKDSAGSLDIAKTVLKAELVATKTNQVLATASLTKVGSDLIVSFSDNQITTINVGQTKFLSLRLQYGQQSGAEIQASMTEIKGKGKNSQQSISVATSFLNIIMNSFTHFLVSTRPAYTKQQLGNSNLQGGSQKELMRFLTSAIPNPNNTSAKLTVQGFTFTLQKTNATAQNGKLYYLSGSNYIPAPGLCYPLSKTKYECININLPINAGSNISFSFRADLGLKADATIKTDIDNITQPDYKGDLSWWSDGKTYHSADITSFNLATSLSGGGNGSLYDTQRPFIQNISLSNLGNSAGMIDNGDYVYIFLNEEIDPSAFNSNLTPYSDNNISSGTSGSLVACTNTSNKLTYLELVGGFSYVDSAFANTDSCNKYSTKLKMYSDIIHVYIDSNEGNATPHSGGYYASLFEDLNGNLMTAPPPIPSGSF